MKQIRTNRILQIVYPLLLYFFIYQLGVSLFIDLFADKYGKLICLLIPGIACIIPIYLLYRRLPKPIPEKITEIKQIYSYIVWVLAVVIIGIILNVIITNSGLIESSKGFEKASETLSDGSLFVKILCNVVVIPILEELVFRGITAGQLFVWYGSVPAIIISAFCFGIIHNNIVQFIYALIMGVLLGVLYIKNKRITLCFIAHGLINLFAIIFG